MDDRKMAEEWFDKNCIHSYADNEEQLKEDCVLAFIAGFHKKDNKEEDCVKLKKKNKKLEKQINKAKTLLEKVLDVYIPQFYRPKEFNLVREEIAKFLEECENKPKD